MSRETADVVVVGGGIIGLCIAYQISRRDSRRVVVLEKAHNVGEGSTGASSAILRQRYTHSDAIKVARDGRLVYADWAGFTGLDEPRAGFHRTGVLWMMGESKVEASAVAAVMSALGVAVGVLDASGVTEHFPSLSTCNEPLDLTFETDHACEDHDGGFLFEEEGGYFDPVSACQDLLEACRREGVDVRFRHAVDAVRTTGGRVDGVHLADGSVIDAPVVVNAAGPWGPALARMAGLDWEWNMYPIRAQVIYREWPSEVRGPLPVVGDDSGGIYFRPETAGAQILVGSIREEDELERIDEPDHFNQSIDAAFKDTKIHALHHRIPSLPYRGSITGVAGLYTMNADDVHPVIGPTAVEGFVVANGFSGHGFKEAPSVGSMIAQWLTGITLADDTDADMGFFAVDRDPIAMDQKVVLA